MDACDQRNAGLSFANRVEEVPALNSSSADSLAFVNDPTLKHLQRRPWEQGAYYSMAIHHKDIKLLWGKSAGRCSYPGCQEDLAPLLINSGQTILGEMAHIIGRTPRSARSVSSIGVDDTYANLILLCPTHHTMVDKAPSDYPAGLLLKWKSDWEGRVFHSFPHIDDRVGLFREIHSRLVENHQVHAEWGPTSPRARNDPQSFQSASYWQLRRVGVVLPNNQAIVNLLRANQHLLHQLNEWPIAVSFIEHAEFFARHCIEPRDSTAYLPFPIAFSDLITGEVEDGQRE